MRNKLVTSDINMSQSFVGLDVDEMTVCFQLTGEKIP